MEGVEWWEPLFHGPVRWGGESYHSLVTCAFRSGASAQATCVRRASNEGREQTPRRSFFSTRTRAHRSSIESCCATYVPAGSQLAIDVLSRGRVGRLVDPTMGSFANMPRDHGPLGALTAAASAVANVFPPCCVIHAARNGTSRLQPWMSSSRLSFWLADCISFPSSSQTTQTCYDTFCDTTIG